MLKSNIQWTDATWNIARGCTKVDEDCKFCYMYRDSMDSTRYNPLQVVRTKTVFNTPLKIKEPSKIFTSSLTDVFHPAIDSYRNEMWNIIRRCPHHTFQILTKRPERLFDCVPKQPEFDFPVHEVFENVWFGTSVGSEDGRKRIFDLLGTIDNGITFLSAEPLHGPLDIKEFLQVNTEWHESEYPMFGGLNWVIIGGESGNEKGKYRYRECKLEWIERIIDDCQQAGVAVFVKQLGTHLAKQLKLSDRHGGNIDEWPEHLKIREFPITNP